MEKICKNCGAEMKTTDKFCRNCGGKLSAKYVNGKYTFFLFSGIGFVIALLLIFSISPSRNSTSYQNNYEVSHQEQMEAEEQERARKLEEENRAKKIAEEQEKARKAAEAERQKQEQILIQNDEMRFYNQQVNDGYYFIQVSADALMNELKSNAARASNKFKGKYVKITDGKIGRIDSDGDYFSLDSVSNSSIFSDVSCYARTPNSRQEVLKLNKGTPATIYGKITDVGDILGYKLNILYIE